MRSALGRRCLPVPPRHQRSGGAVRTLCLREPEAEVVALFEDTLAPLLYEIVETLGEDVHARAQVIEAKVESRERVGHGRDRKVTRDCAFGEAGRMVLSQKCCGCHDML